MNVKEFKDVLNNIDETLEIYCCDKKLGNGDLLNNKRNILGYFINNNEICLCYDDTKKEKIEIEICKKDIKDRYNKITESYRK